MGNTRISDGLKIFSNAVHAVHPYILIPQKIDYRNHILKITGLNKKRHRYNLSNYRRLIVVGAGKASAYMAKALEAVIGDRIHGGYIVTKYEHKTNLNKITCAEAGHPIPDMNSLKHTKKIVDLLRECTDQDLVICLISGGASSLLIYPEKTITLENIQECTNLLIQNGANIREINAIRKSICRVKGGGLAEFAYPATVLSLIISDVIGDVLSDIGSGPTVRHDAIPSAANQVIEKLNIRSKLPKTVKNLIHLKQNHKYQAFDKENDRIFRNVENILIGNNIACLDAAGHTARSLGYSTIMLTSVLNGTTNETADIFVEIAQSVYENHHPIKPPACIVAGGETTVTVKGKGLGGRNQELTLSFLSKISDVPDFLFMSCGTDGTDGPTDAAGAYATHETKRLAIRKGIDPNKYLLHNDSYHFFEKTEGLIKSGPTGTNVMDIQIMLKG